MQIMAKRVVVIGAGAAGLAALRNLVANKDLITATAFEQTSQVGGTWVYTEKTGLDEYGQPVHASMYSNLRTNLPKEVMAYPDFPFRKDIGSFITHSEVKEYLESYADHFKLLPHIKFFSKVDKIEPCYNGNDITWSVAVKDVRNLAGPPQVLQYDAVIVCNGHYSVPLMPDIPGLDSFPGSVMHSHNYRHPEVYRDMRVVLLGAQSSGQDITLDLAPLAKEVILCHRKNPLKSTLPQNVSQRPGIVSISGDTVILEDGSRLSEVDALLFCTGYKYIFPFLTPVCHPKIMDERVPLYKHLIDPKFPSLSFIGIPKVICPFPQFHMQVKLILSVLLGNISLPTQEEMEEDIERDFQDRLDRGLPARHAHHMGPNQWAYNDEMASMGGFDPIPRVVQKLYDDVHMVRATSLATYKQRNYILLDDDTFKEVDVN